MGKGKNRLGWRNGVEIDWSYDEWGDDYWGEESGDYQDDWNYYGNDGDDSNDYEYDGHFPSDLEDGDWDSDGSEAFMPPEMRQGRILSRMIQTGARACVLSDLAEESRSESKSEGSCPPPGHSRVYLREMTRTAYFAGADEDFLLRAVDAKRRHREARRKRRLRARKRNLKGKKAASTDSSSSSIDLLSSSSSLSYLSSNSSSGGEEDEVTHDRKYKLSCARHSNVFPGRRHASHLESSPAKDSNDDSFNEDEDEYFSAGGEREFLFISKFSDWLCLAHGTWSDVCQTPVPFGKFSAAHATPGTPTSNPAIVHLDHDDDDELVPLDLGVEGPLADIEEIEFTIQASDGIPVNEGDSFVATVSGPNGGIPVELTGNGVGTYSGKYRAAEFGLQEEIVFTIQASVFEGIPVTEGDLVVAVSDPNGYGLFWFYLTDNGDGTYSGKYQLMIPHRACFRKVRLKRGQTLRWRGFEILRQRDCKLGTIHDSNSESEDSGDDAEDFLEVKWSSGAFTKAARSSGASSKRRDRNSLD